MTKNKVGLKKIRLLGGYKASLAMVLKQKGRYSQDGHKVISYATQTARREHLFKAFGDLRQLGFKLQFIDNLKGKHIHALAKHYEDCLKKGDLSISTVLNRFSHLRTLGHWIGQPTLVKPFNHYVEGKYHRALTATQSKTWSDAGVDAQEKINFIRRQSERLGDALALQLAFGLRSKESLLLRPHLADKGDVLVITHGTKGGRDRFVAITTEEQRAIINRIKTYVKPTESLVPKDQRYETFRRHYYRTLQKYGISRTQGITPHGLRHEHLNNLYRQVTGHASPAQGGALHTIDPDQDHLGRQLVSERAGHGREEISSAYLGGKQRIINSIG